MEGMVTCLYGVSFILLQVKNGAVRIQAETVTVQLVTMN
jgi:hypothetical protein